jgi:hypothetical protein
VQNGITVAGGNVDRCLAMTPDFGQWRPGLTPTQEDDMAFDDTDKERLRQVWAVLGTAYADSEDATDTPVKDIGQQVFETHERLEQLDGKVDKLLGLFAGASITIQLPDAPKGS